METVSEQAQVAYIKVRAEETNETTEATSSKFISRFPVTGM
jgi:hypothetical protein